MRLRIAEENLVVNILLVIIVLKVLSRVGIIMVLSLSVFPIPSVTKHLLLNFKALLLSLTCTMGVNIISSLWLVCV